MLSSPEDSSDCLVLLRPNMGAAEDLPLVGERFFKDLASFRLATLALLLQLLHDCHSSLLLLSLLVPRFDCILPHGEETGDHDDSVRFEVAHQLWENGPHIVEEEKEILEPKAHEE